MKIKIIVTALSLLVGAASFAQGCGIIKGEGWGVAHVPAYEMGWAKESSPSFDKVLEEDTTVGENYYTEIATTTTHLKPAGGGEKLDLESEFKLSEICCLGNSKIAKELCPSVPGFLKAANHSNSLSEICEDIKDLIDYGNTINCSPSIAESFTHREEKKLMEFQTAQEYSRGYISTEHEKFLLKYQLRQIEDREKCETDWTKLRESLLNKYCDIDLSKYLSQRYTKYLEAE